MSLNFNRIIFLLGTLAGKIARKFGLPEVSIYIVIGMIFGPSGLNAFSIQADSTVNQLILLFGASFIIFHGGTITSLNVLKQVWTTVTLLSTTGVLITAFIVAAAASWVFHIHFLIALLLGSAVTFVAILVTLVIQTSTTPWLARKLNLLEKRNTSPVTAYNLEQKEDKLKRRH